MPEYRFRHFLSQYLEELMQVAHHLRMRSEQSRIGIQVSCLLIEIAGADVGKALLVASILEFPKHECYLGMHLQPLHAINDMDTGLLHHLGSSQVVLLIESGLQFHKYRHLLAILCSSYQGIDNRRVWSYPILRNHDFRYRRVVNGLVKEVDEMVERIIRIMYQQVALAHV